MSDHVNRDTGPDMLDDETDLSIECKKQKVVEPNVTLIPVMPTIEEADEEDISVESTQSLSLQIPPSDIGEF